MDPFTTVFIIVVLLIAVAILAWQNSMAVKREIPKLEVPTTEIGTPIPVLYGKRCIKSVILAEYGDVEIEMRDPQSGGKK